MKADPNGATSTRMEFSNFELCTSLLHLRFLESIIPENWPNGNPTINYFFGLRIAARIYMVHAHLEEVLYEQARPQGSWPRKT